MEVFVKYLGRPEIFIDNKKLELNKNKLKLILLYILYNEKCTRDELATMFWEEHSDVKAKANLRNAIYQIKQFVGEELLDTQGNLNIDINKKVNLKKDIDIFIEENINDIVINEHIFMDKVYLKDSETFNEWIDSVRYAYENMYVNLKKVELNNSNKIKNTAQVINIADQIIEVDPYNEEAHREIIKAHIRSRNYNDAIKLYKKLEKKVNEDLGVSLEDSTKELYNLIIASKERNEKSDMSSYFERVDLSLALQRELDRFINKEPYLHTIVCGEIGVGKSKLIDKFLEASPFDIIKLELRHSSKDIELGTIKEILSYFNIDVDDPYNGLKDLIYYLESKNEAYIIYLKNLEFIDTKSLIYIEELLISTEQFNIFFIFEYSDSFVDSEEKNRKIRFMENTIALEVGLLSIHETINYITFLKGKSLESIDMEDVYSKTKGNIMFIEVYLNNKEESNTNIVKELLFSFSEQELDVIRKISIFEEAADYKYLEKLLEGNKMENLKLIDGLVRKKILISSKSKLEIKYPFIKSRVYSEMSDFYRYQLHGKLASMLKEDKTNDYETYKSISYHFGKIGDEFNHVYYKLKSIELSLNYYDQFFPTLRNMLNPKDIYLDRDSIYREFDEIIQQINSIKSSMDGESYSNLLMLYDFLLGRMMIGGGKSEQGKKYIDDLLIIAKKMDSDEYLIKTYIEYIHYGIHKGSKEIMKANIELAKELVDKDKDYTEYAELLRLEGLYEIKNNNLERAKVLLIDSISAFDIPSLYNSNFFAIAVANNYLGNIYTMEKQYDKAENSYLKSIEKCRENDVYKSLDIFYADYGYMLFTKGDLKKAKEVFKNALKVYDLLGTHWKRSLVESAMGLIAISEGDFKKATEHLRKSEIFFRKDQKSEELELLSKLKAALEK